MERQCGNREQYDRNAKYCSKEGRFLNEDCLCDFHRSKEKKKTNEDIGTR